MERITVIVPARNAQKTIRRAALSILKVLPSDGRLLFLDDASDDGTSAILAELARTDRRVGVLTSSVNLGVAEALNVLIDAADTRLIARMDADDISLPWRFRHQIRAMCRDNLDIVFSSTLMFGRFPTLIRPQGLLSAGPVMSPYELLLMNTLPHPTLLGRRSIFTGAGGYRRVPAEDWDLWMRLALEGCRLGRVALPNILYRNHTHQASSRDNWYSPLTAQVHDELSQRLLGFSESGAFVALSGPFAKPREVEAATNLVEAVRTAATSLQSSSDRVSMRLTLWLAMHRLRGIYGLT